MMVWADLLLRGKMNSLEGSGLLRCGLRYCCNGCWVGAMEIVGGLDWGSLG